MAEQVTKIDIFSGFLGAGKTTLIKKLIKEAFQGEKIVLIENEFGEIGIDGGFMREAGIQVNELNSGCICCSLVGDFREALKKVVETYHPDRILIEPSGVGKLSDVTRAVEGVGETLPVSLNSFVTVADVNKVKMYMKNFGEFYDDQISHASCIILSRTGSADEKKLAAAVALIQEKNPTATIVTTDWNELTGAQIVSVMDGKRDLVAELLSEAQASNAAHADEDEEEHHHHHHDHDEDGHECCHHHHDHDDDDDDDDDGFRRIIGVAICVGFMVLFLADYISKEVTKKQRVNEVSLPLVDGAQPKLPLYTNGALENLYVTYYILSAVGCMSAYLVCDNEHQRTFILIAQFICMLPSTCLFGRQMIRQNVSTGKCKYLILPDI